MKFPIILFKHSLKMLRRLDDGYSFLFQYFEEMNLEKVVTSY